MTYYPGWDVTCPDCKVPSRAVPGSWMYEPCGLSKSEHKRLRKLRAQAERQAHQLAVQARERQMLPRALIKEVYDQAERDVRRQRGR